MGFSQFGAGEFAALLRDCGQGAALIGIVWIVFRLVPRVPAAARCLVWWMLCLKMLVGLVLVTAPVRLAVLPAATASQIAAVQSAPTPIPLPRREGAQILHPSASGGPGWAPTRGVRGRLLKWTALLQAFWLSGMGVFLTLLVAQFIKAALMRREASIAPPGRCWEVMTAAAKALRVAPRPPVFISLRAHSPLTAGLLKPVILLPGKDAFTLSDDELLMVLAHETAHIRRRDLWLGLIPAAAQAVFFFYPPVWLAHREYLLAREEACDALALSATNLPADEYGRLLLRFGTTRGGASAAVAISGAQAARALRRRLAMLSASPTLTVRQRWVWSAGLCAFGVLCLTPVALTGRAAPSSHPDPETVASTGHLTTRRLTLRTVAPDMLKQTVEVADARLAASPDGASSHVAQAPVEIRELPSGVIPLAPQAPTLPPAPHAPPAPPTPPAEPASASPDLVLRPAPAPDPAPTPRVHVVVPPIAPIHVHVAPIHIHVPDINVNIPDIKVDIPAMPGFTVDGSRADRMELSDKEKRAFFKQWQGPGLSDKDKELFRQWNGNGPQSRRWEKDLQGFVRQEYLDEAERDREDVQRDRQDARQEAAQDRAEAVADAKEAREEANQEAAEAKQEAQQETADAREEARQEAAEGMDSAQESLSEAESELREELRGNSSGIARQALEQALKCVQKSRKTLPK